jgi:hypothetical protein
VERALLLLAYACPDESWESLAALPVGRRDARLLTLREWTFGSHLSSMARCPACGEPLELSFSVDDIRIEAASTAPELDLKVGGYEVAFRLPDSADLASLDGLDESAEVRHQLLKRCLLTARRDGKKRSARRLPARVVDAVVQRMAEADPQADVRTALSCPACAHTWQATFDIATYFWAEIESWAYRMLRDVHRLASAYGWREADILALGPRRRQFYLEMVHL